jgi:hypothetical protein
MGLVCLTTGRNQRAKIIRAGIVVIAVTGVRGWVASVTARGIKTLTSTPKAQAILGITILRIT